MSDFALVLTVSAVAILVFDAAACYMSKRLAVGYSRFIPGSYVMYLIAGFLAGRSSGIAAGAMAGAWVALVEATLGWALSWWIGPGRPPFAQQVPFVLLTRVAAGVVLTGALMGLVAGLAATLL